ncbi:unnamed protein product [Durusdinium trenchii]|uniref:Uncharacterized protein n=1 Tax=Durusdinium trenchii TaxID=1381693 RepID=A0ABP0RGB8_9DINO
MAGHRHDAMQTNQNLGNTLGSRSAVRQTHFFRKYESGNTMKALLGTPNLSWDVTRKQGAYEGRIEDPYAASPVREVTGGVGTSQKVNSKILEHKAAAKVQHEDYQANDGHDRAKRFSQKVARGNKAVESSSRWQTSSAAYGNF